MTYRVFAEDCVTGMRRHVADETVDLIIADPPYGIAGETLDKHYARDESNVVPGYIDVPLAAYAGFSRDWIAEAARVLRPGGSIYIISGYTGLRDVLNALSETNLVEVNHLIWRFNFGVFTTKKWVSGHYHILYYVKPGRRKGDRPVTFNTFSRYSEATDSYHDREDVLVIDREYRPGKIKNKNQLPTALLERLILYSSDRGDTILDPFLGGFTTAHVGLRYGRHLIGFELNAAAVDAFLPGLATIDEEPDPTPIPPDPEALQKRLAMRSARNTRRKRLRDAVSTDAAESDDATRLPLST